MSATCRLCDSTLTRSVVDLGVTPLANSYLRPADLEKQETAFPLHAQVCENCWLVQVPQFESTDSIFRDYAYFSSYSESWVEHARRYTEEMIRRFGLSRESFVLELASNDGYLLRHFLEREIPCLGVEPARNVAQAAIKSGVPTLAEFFDSGLGQRLALEGQDADLVIANNVLAQVPELRDFCAGIRAVLREEGVMTAEFPHLLQTLAKNEFDTVYHEHFSYFSLHSVQTAFEQAGVRIFDVEELPTHGGSLRIYGCRTESARADHARVAALLRREREAGLLELSTYEAFHTRVEKLKTELVGFLSEAAGQGKTVVGYGAPAKGNTLLNYCGITPDLLPYTVDRSPHKQGCFLPGSRIPVFSPDKIRETRPDYLLILPWNLADEIMEQCAFIREWGGRFVLPIPEVTIR